MRGMKKVGEWGEVMPQPLKKKDINHEFSSFIGSISKEVGALDVIDFGCGDGSLCKTFSKNAYLGLDIDSDILTKAKQKFEGYAFNAPDQKIYNTDMCICSRVLSQLDDEKVHDIIRRMRCKWLLIAEPLKQEEIDSSIYPFYTRERESYVNLLRHHDLLLVKHVCKPSSVNSNEHVSFLLFKKFGRNPVASY